MGEYSRTNRTLRQAAGLAPNTMPYQRPSTRRYRSALSYARTSVHSNPFDAPTCCAGHPKMRCARPYAGCHDRNGGRPGGGGTDHPRLLVVGTATECRTGRGTGAGFGAGVCVGRGGVRGGHRTAGAAGSRVRADRGVRAAGTPQVADRRGARVDRDDAGRDGLPDGPGRAVHAGRVRCAAPDHRGADEHAAGGDVHRHLCAAAAGRRRRRGLRPRRLVRADALPLYGGGAGRTAGPVRPLHRGAAAG